MALTDACVVGLDSDSLVDRPVQPFSPSRFDVVVAVAQLPDEAFGFLCGQLVSVSNTAGGFRADARAALEAIGPRALAWLQAAKVES